jgi:hypothetical protein
MRYFISLYRSLEKTVTEIQRGRNPLTPSGNYMNEPSALTVSNAVFCIYWFCMVLIVNSDYFLKQR